VFIDKDGDGNPDEILAINLFNRPNGKSILSIMIKNSQGVKLVRFDINVDSEGLPQYEAYTITAEGVGNSPVDLSVFDFELIPESSQGYSRIQYRQNQSEASLLVLTNYGMLIKTGIDISSLLLGTDDVSLKDNDLLLYPNPATNIVSFSDETLQNIEVFDINGRSVLKKQGASFSVKTLAQGIYIVKATNTDNIIITKKLIVD